jgi:hypothetical protein
LFARSAELVSSAAEEMKFSSERPQHVRLCVNTAKRGSRRQPP